MIGLVVGGVASGVGKTTLTLGLIGALKRRCLAVQPFKVGPDYIDPSQHAQVAGRPSRNLDAWMVPELALRALFHRAASRADAAIVEGVMGLFDGRTGEGETGSTAHVAKLLGLPVLLVVDAAKVGRSVAATVLGCTALDPDLQVVGVVLNNLAGERHAAVTCEAIESLTGVPVLGWLPRHAELRQDERYLGLVPSAERRVSPELVDRVTALVERQIDLDRLTRLTAVPLTQPEPTELFPAEPRPARARIALAQDAAFSFYYQDSLDLLTAWGAELVPFSPLEHAALPEGVGAVYLGGGFPELFARDLAANTAMLAALRAAARAGVPIYGECGGLMYLQGALEDAEGTRHVMAGVIPGTSTLAGKRLSLGYREVRARRATPIAAAGQQLRGHEFHWSASTPPSDEIAAYDVLGDTGRVEGFATGSVLASYVHLHFATDSRIAPRFVAAASKADLTPPAPLSHERRGLRGANIGCADIPSAARDPRVGAERGERNGGRLGSEVERPAAWKPAPTAKSVSHVGAGFQQPVAASPDPNLPPSPQQPVAASPNPNLPHGHPPLRAGEGGRGGEVSPGPLLLQHGLPPDEIEALSRRRIDALLANRIPPAEPLRSLVARLVYAAGDPDLAERVACVGDPIERGVEALRGHAPLVADVQMVAAGISRSMLAAIGADLHVAIAAEGGPNLAARYGITRSAAGILALGEQLDGAVVAIGNAPTALLALLDLVRERGVTPAVVIGMPVGYVGAEESKELLLAAGVPCIVVRGTRGGSALAAATVNFLLRLAAESRPAGTAASQPTGDDAPPPDARPAAPRAPGRTIQS